jgi:hypothetical protein|tara:strand:- start:836 stop:1027 length:192 start_codon:yes stop_codon:yes gene_type:complete
MAYTTAFRSTVQDVSDRSIRNMWTSSVGTEVVQQNTTVYWRTAGATQTKAVTEAWTTSTTTPA